MQSVAHFADEIIFNLKLGKIEQLKPMQFLSRSSGVSAQNINRGLVSGACFVALALAYIFAHNSVYFFLSVAYPAYKTAQVINNEDLSSRNGKLYLSYWAIFGLMTIFNWSFGFILRWIPFSHFMQCAFTVWLYSQKTRGAEFLNKLFLEPFLGRYGSVVDKHIQQVKEPMKKDSNPSESSQSYQ